MFLETFITKHKKMFFLHRTTVVHKQLTVL